MVKDVLKKTTNKPVFQYNIGRVKVFTVLVLVTLSLSSLCINFYILGRMQFSMLEGDKN